MALLSMFVAALLSSQGAPAPAEAPTAPASEALVERFMTVIPEADRLNQVDRAADPQELARLGRLNAGRSDEIRPVLEAFAACQSPINNELARTGLRAVARSLGDARLSRLIAFYQSDDFRRLDAIVQRANRGESMTAADEVEAARIMEAYSVADFNATMERVLTETYLARQDEMAALTRCEEEKRAALERLGIDTVGPVLTPVPPRPRDPDAPPSSCDETAETAEAAETVPACPARRRRED
jgi:hypothetical protein